MKRSHLIATLSAVVLGFISLSSHAVPVSGQGTWETTLHGRDLDGNAATFEAYWDETLDITWLADANFAQTSGFDGGFINWADANAWATGLNVNGITGWRLPTNTPLNGSTYDTTFSNNGITDLGTATTTTDGTDGGWRDGAGNPVSEMGHMFYVTLGNLGLCTPNGSGFTMSCETQIGSGLSNTADFLNIQLGNYWSGSEINFGNAWRFNFGSGNQGDPGGGNNPFTWAVRSGDVGISAVPVPAAVWLFGSGLLGLIGMARRKQAA